jgi:crossover junction endodeoxyribonuclease RusA
MIDVFLEVKPTPKGRPRFGKNGNVYTPKKTSDAEAEIRLLLRMHMSSNRLKCSPKSISVIMNFYYSNKDRTDGYKASRPDLDNLIKILMDSMIGIVIHDDAQVVKIESQKLYGPLDGIELKVKEI